MKVTKKYHQISAYDGKPGLEPIYVHRLDLWSPPPVPLPIPFPSPILASFHTMDELEIPDPVLNFGPDPECSLSCNGIRI